MKSNIKTFHTGHYNAINIEESLMTIENICSGDNPYDNAGIFLMGSCQLFSLALNQIFGYEAFEIRSSNALHFFCKEIIDDTEFFVDVRGITTNFSEFLCTSCIADSNAQIKKQDIEEDLKLDNEYDKDGFAFAKKIINDYYEYYDIYGFPTNITHLKQNGSPPVCKCALVILQEKEEKF